MDLWGALEPTFAPVLAWVCLALPAMKRLLSFHSLVLGKVAVFLVAVVKVDTTRVAFVIVALLEDVNGKVASTSNAVVKVDTALEVVRLVAGLVEAWERRPSQARPIALTAVRRV